MTLLKDEEDFEGMSDYDNGRAAPDDEGDDYRGCGIPGCSCVEDSLEWDDDQYPDNGEDDD